MANFTENATFIVSSSIFWSHEVIKTAANKYFAQFQLTKVKIMGVIAQSDRGTVDWT